MGSDPRFARDRTWRRMPAWTPIVTVLLAWAAIIAIYQVLSGEIEKRGLVFDENDIELAARLLWSYFLWGVASAVLATSGLAAAAYALVVLFENLRPHGGRAQVGLTALVVLLTALAYLGALRMQLGPDFDLGDPAMRDMFARLFERVGGSLPARVTGRILSSLGMVLTIPVVAAAVSLLGAGDEHEDLDTLRRKLVQLRTILYISAAALVAGVVHAYGLHMTPTLPGDSPEYVENLRALASAISFGLGGGYSLLLMMAYLPTSLLLRRRVEDKVRAVLPRDASTEERVKLLKVHNLNERWFSGLWRVLAVLAPLLAGLLDVPIAQAVSALTGQ